MNDINTLPFNQIRQKIDDYYNSCLEQELIKLRESARTDEIDLADKFKTILRESANTYILETFVNKFKIASNYSWILPQMIAAFGRWKAIKNSSDLYDPKLTHLENTKDDFNYGIWAVSMLPRYQLIETRFKIYEIKYYNNFVPLVLSGFKKYQNIPYSSWDVNGLDILVNKDLYDAMTATIPELSEHERLILRNMFTTVKTGKRAGSVSNPATAASLYHLKDYKDHDLTVIPKLALHMMLQTWCAHPSNRSEYMILNPSNWDDIPKPLVSTDIYNKPQNNMPW